MENNTTNRAVTHHCSNCGNQVDAEGSHEHRDDACRTALIESVSTLLASDGTPLGVGVRVEGGNPGSEDFDTGEVIEVRGDEASVAWDSCVNDRFWTPATELRAEAE